MDCIIVSFEDFYKHKTDNANPKIKEAIESLPKFESPQRHYNIKMPKSIPKHLDNFRNVNKCYKRELNSFMNKINNDNYVIIAPKIISLLTNDNTNYIINFLLEKSHTEHNYMNQVIAVLKEIKETTKYSGDISFYVYDFYINFTENLINMLEDVKFLYTSNMYDDFCVMNKRKRNLINYGLCIVKLIDNAILEATYEEYFEMLFRFLCEYIDDTIYNEILLEMIIQFIEYKQYRIYMEKIKVFYTSKISQKFNLKSRFRVKDLLENM